MKRSVFLAVTVPVVLSILLFSPGVSRAACVKRDITAGERAFFVQVKSVMDKALPAPENWRRRDSWMHVPDTVCEGFEDNPIPYIARFKFTRITESERIQEARQKEVASPRPMPITAKLKINDKRKAIGKKFEIQAMANTVKTFETVSSPGTDHERVTKILLIGNWRVEDFMKNWNLFRPEVPYDAIGGIHLGVSGKRADVEKYLAQTARIGMLAEATQ